MPEEKKEEALTEVIKDEDVVKTTIDAKELKDTDELYMFKCTQCGGVHFRHAGYMEMLLPYVLADKQKKIQKESHQVHVCVKCKKSFIWHHPDMYDVSNLIDLEAWGKAEVELNRATGPGGEC